MMLACCCCPSLLVHRVFTPTQQQQQEEQQKKKDAAATMSLASLSAVAVLRWAAARPLKAAEVSHIAAALKLTAQLLHWTIVIASSYSSQLDPQQTANRSHMQQQQQQRQQPLPPMQWWLTGELLEQALGLTSTFVQKFWALLTAEEAAAAAAVGAAADAGSSSSGTSSSSSTTPVLSDGYWAMLKEAADVLYWLKAHAGALHAADLTSRLERAGSGPQDMQQPTTSSKAWAKHMPLLLRPLEALMRTFAHDQRAPGCIVRMVSQLLEAFDGPAALLASYWRRPGASRDPQLISTCFSLLKAMEVCPPTQKGKMSPERSEVLHVVLRLCLEDLKSMHDSSAQQTACAGSSADETAAGLSSSSSSSKAVSVLPWLVLLGRCCPFWAGELQYSLSAPSAAVLLALLDSLSSTMKMAKVKVVECVLRAQEACLAWLQGDSNAAELAAAGYDTRPVIAALQALPPLPPGAAQHNAAASDSRTAVGMDAQITAFAQQLQPLSRALSTLAISCACNNPHCSNLDGLSELELVQGRARLCGKCRVARYCSRECQAQHWKLHKPACKALEAAQQAQSNAETLDSLD